MLKRLHSTLAAVVVSTFCLYILILMFLFTAVICYTIVCADVVNKFIFYIWIYFQYKFFSFAIIESQENLLEIATS